MTAMVNSLRPTVVTRPDSRYAHLAKRTETLTAGVELHGCAGTIAVVFSTLCRHVRPGLWKNYSPTASNSSAPLFDELQEADGSVRPHWQMFVNLLDDLGPRELGRRWDTARQLIHDNGVSYNVYGDPAGMDRPWNLDTIPLMFDAPSWNTLQAGLTQRARLLDLILADLYGPQRLLHDGLLPPEILFAHGDFCGRFMRSFPRGAGCTCIQRTSGVHRMGNSDHRGPHPSPVRRGYALENRIVVSRALPDVFRDCRIQRLATFFQRWRDAQESCSAKPRQSAHRSAYPGPYNETYFEHATSRDTWVTPLWKGAILRCGIIMCISKRWGVCSASM